MEVNPYNNNVSLSTLEEFIDYKPAPIIDDLMINLDLITGKLSSLADIFECSICQNIAFTPRECQKCLNIFCKICIDNWMSSNKRFCPFKCPNVSVSDYIEISHRKLKQILNDLELKCLYNEKGCTEIIKYENYQKHFMFCEYGNFKCCYRGNYEEYSLFFNECRFKGSKAEVMRHNIECKYRPDKCQYCKALIQKPYLQIHFNICPRFPIECKDCKLVIERILLKDSHSKEDCILNLKKNFSLEINNIKKSKEEEITNLKSLYEDKIISNKNSSLDEIKFLKSFYQNHIEEYKLSILKEKLRNINSKSEKVKLKLLLLQNIYDIKVFNYKDNFKMLSNNKEIKIEINYPKIQKEYENNDG